MSCVSVQEGILKGQSSPRRNRLLNAEQIQTPRSSSLQHIYRQQSPITNTQHIITVNKNLPSSNLQYLQLCSTRSTIHPITQQQQQQQQQLQQQQTKRPPLANFNAMASTPRGTLSQAQQNIRLKPTPSPQLPTNIKTGLQISAQKSSEVQVNLQQECENSQIKMVPTSNSPARMAVISLTKANSVIAKTSPMTQKSIKTAPSLPPSSQPSSPPPSHTNDKKFLFKAQTSENTNEVPILRQNIQMLTECLTKANNDLERKKTENEDLKRQLCTTQQDSIRIKQSIDTLLQKNQELNAHLTQAKVKEQYI